MQKPLKFESEIGSGVPVSIITDETLGYVTWGHVKLQKGDLEAADGHFREDNIRVWVSFKLIIWLLPLKYSTLTQAILWWQFGAVKYLWCKLTELYIESTSFWHGFHLDHFGSIGSMLAWPSKALEALEAHNACGSLCSFDGAQLLQSLSGTTTKASRTFPKLVFCRDPYDFFLQIAESTFLCFSLCWCRDVAVCSFKAHSKSM